MDPSSRAVPQAVTAPLTRAAIFLVMTLKPGPESRATVLSLCADLSAPVRIVGFRDIEAGLSCVMGIGSEAWGRLFGAGVPRPAQLHPFREFHSGPRHAPATAGDLLFHLRAQRMDLCFELAMLVAAQIGAATVTVDEVHGFRYFDDRDVGAFVLTARGGDFELTIGQDTSIGYLSHTDTVVRLYLQESFTFRYLTSEAAVALAPPG